MVNAIASMFMMECVYCEKAEAAPILGTLPGGWAYRWFSDDNDFHIRYGYHDWIFCPQGSLYCSDKCFEEANGIIFIEE